MFREHAVSILLGKKFNKFCIEFLKKYLYNNCLAAEHHGTNSIRLQIQIV